VKSIFLSHLLILKYKKERWMIMIKKAVKLLFIFGVISLFFMGTVTAAINTIVQGNVIFIGEEGLDISAAMGGDNQIGWWASAADLSGSSPTKTVDLRNRIASFSASPIEFSDYPGNWYRLNSAGRADGIAFNIIDPQLDIKVEDTTVPVDAALNWIPTGDDIRFRIENNLAQMANQRSSPPLITIKVKGPDGGMYTSLYDAGGNPTSIVNIPVTTTPFYTGSIWNMGNRDRYSPGTYTLWAECNVNKMNDNYDVTGKTRSREISLLNQGQNPLITIPTTQIPQTSSTPIQTIATSLPTPTGSGTTIFTPTPSQTLATTPSPDITVLQPTRSQTKTPGFEAILAFSAIFLGVVFYLKKE
jgi:hypothetical protein